MENNTTLKQAIQNKIKRGKLLKIVSLVILALLLFSLGYIASDKDISNQIKSSIKSFLNIETEESPDETLPEVIKNENEKIEEDLVEDPPVEEEKDSSQEEIPQETKKTTKPPTPVPTEPTTPTLKCTQYEYEYATAFIPAATEVYNELYASYQKEVAEFESCMYGQTWNELYEMCDSKLSSLITDPVARGNLIRQCIQSYYSDCEMNNSSEWYETQMANKLAAINVQKAILDSCY